MILFLTFLITFSSFAMHSENEYLLKGKAKLINYSGEDIEAVPLFYNQNNASNPDSYFDRVPAELKYELSLFVPIINPAFIFCFEYLKQSNYYQDALFKKLIKTIAFNKKSKKILAPYLKYPKIKDAIARYETKLNQVKKAIQENDLTALQNFLQTEFADLEKYTKGNPKLFSINIITQIKKEIAYLNALLAEFDTIIYKNQLRQKNYLTFANCDKTHCNQNYDIPCAVTSGCCFTIAMILSITLYCTLSPNFLDLDWCFVQKNSACFNYPTKAPFNCSESRCCDIPRLNQTCCDALTSCCEQIADKICAQLQKESYISNVYWAPWVIVSLSIPTVALLIYCVAKNCIKPKIVISEDIEQCVNRYIKRIELVKKKAFV